MKERIWYLDFIKVVGVLAVVIIHVISERWYDLDVNSVSFFVLTLLDSICRFAVPVYFMVSGALFLRDENNITIKEILLKYVLRIFVIFFVWNVVYSILTVIIIDKGVITLSVIAQTLLDTLLGNHIFHLYFLVTIIGFYLCVPILKKITKKENKQTILYFIAILFLFINVNGLINALFNVKMQYPLLFSGYIIYFLIGYYLNTFELSKKTARIIYVLGVISLIITMVGTMWYSNKTGAPHEAFFDYSSVNVVIWSSAVFLFIKRNYRVKREKVLSFFSKTYFGIYLVHALVVGLLEKIDPFASMPLIINCILKIILVYALSLASTYIALKIPYVRYMFTTSWQCEKKITGEK